MDRFSLLLLLLLLLLTACGGRAHSGDGVPAAGQGGGAGSGGTSAAAGAGDTDGAPLLLDDAFPWFDGAGSGRFPSGPIDEVLHITASGTPARATLSTHNVVDILSHVDTLQFKAKASASTRLLVSASNDIPPYDYFAERDAGARWPIAAVDVGTAWQEFSVRLADMQPREMGDSDGVPSFFLAFIVEHPEPVEVWLDEVHFTGSDP
jgi:hypothetical protein